MADVMFTSTPEHEYGLGFVVPTFIVGKLGGGYSTLTCRDCHHEAHNGHHTNCPQAPPPLGDQAREAGK